MNNYYIVPKKTNFNLSCKPLLLFFCRMLLIICLTILVMLIGVNKSSAQGQIDPAFNPGDNGFRFTEGANRDVKAIALQPDGKILIGGDFTSYNETVINKIARLTSAGLSDASFITGTGADSTVNDILLQQMVKYW
ncbi:MAG: delta-60 repeat domain-containing protein [Ferruginibacter sp.]|nr:delta-60 repeat domain-containing protein [Ferruginibacter sp.]